MIPFETTKPCLSCGKTNFRRYGKICGTCYNKKLKEKSESYRKSLRIYDEKRREIKRRKNELNTICITCRTNFVTGRKSQKRCPNCIQMPMIFLETRCMQCEAKFIPIRTKQFHCTPKCFTKFYGTVRNKDKKRFYESVREGRIRSSGGTFSYSMWEELKGKYGHKCASCGKPTKLTIDHIIPVSKGGTNNIENIQPLCFKCNIIKGTKTIKYDIPNMERQIA